MIWPTVHTAVAIPSAAGTSCPDIQVVWARGTGEPPGVGVFGQEFVDALTPMVSGRSLGVYAVNYPATFDPSSADAGAQDAAAHVESMAVNCPNTRMVLGGDSQGALVIDLITMGPVQILFFQPVPMPPSVVDHVAALAVFGNPLRKIPFFGPLTQISPLYGSKAIDLCAAGDLFCDPLGFNFLAHLSYGVNGMVGQAATFAANQLNAAAPLTTVPPSPPLTTMPPSLPLATLSPSPPLTAPQPSPMTIPQPSPMTIPQLSPLNGALTTAPN